MRTVDFNNANGPAAAAAADPVVGCGRARRRGGRLLLLDLLKLHNTTTNEGQQRPPEYMCAEGLTCSRISLRWSPVSMRAVLVSGCSSDLL